VSFHTSSRWNSCRTDRIDFFTTLLSAVPCGKGERYCSDLLNPDLLRSELTWCAGMSTRICVRVYTQHEAREAAQR
jgi:hypothetical protein